MFFIFGKTNKIDAALHYNPEDISVEEVSWSNFSGAMFTSKKERKGIGVVIAMGMWQNRYSASTLAKRFAAYGYACIAIEAPQHYLNQGAFSLGVYSNQIGQAVTFLRGRGCGRVAVVAHSMGAVASIFSSLGYNQDIEREIYLLWSRMLHGLETSEKATSIGEAMMRLREFEEAYAQIKQLMLRNLETSIKSKSFASCYVLTAPPYNMKKVLPGLRVLKHMDNRIIHTIFSLTSKGLNADVTRGWTEKQDKRDLPENFGFKPTDKKEVLQMQFLQTEDGRQFLQALSNAKEPWDYLKLIEELAKLKKQDGKIGFFEYYLEKYTARRPKMFVYGKRDLLLRPFMPFARDSLETFYKACGNASIHFMDASHLFRSDMKQQVGYEIIQNDKLTEMMIKFIDANTNHLWE